MSLISGGHMAEEKNNHSKELSQELVELFDIKKAKIRDEKRLTFEANEAQKDIRLLSLMFRDGIPDIKIQVNDREFIRWCEGNQQLIYSDGQITQLLEGTSKEVRVRMRPFLKDLVKKAKDFYSDE